MRRPSFASLAASVPAAALLAALLAPPRGLAADGPASSPATAPITAPSTAPATAPAATQPAADAAGDPLPAGAVARLGTVRLRAVNAFYAAGFADDGKTLLTAQDGSAAMRTWDAATGKPLAVPTLNWPTFAMHSPEAVALAPGGRLLTAGNDRVQVWDLATGQLTAERTTEPRANGAADEAVPPDAMPPKPPGQVVSRGKLTWPPIIRVVASPDGKRVAAAAADVWLGDLAAAANDPAAEAAADRPLARVGSHVSHVYALEFSADSSRLLSRGADGAVRVWDAATGKAVCAVLVDYGARFTASVSPDGKRLAVGVDGGVQFHDAATGRAADRSKLPADAGGGGGTVVVRYAPKPAPSGGPALAVWDDAGIKVWDVDAGKAVHAFPPVGADRSPQRASLVFSPDGGRLAAVGAGPTCDVFDLATGKPVVDNAGDPAGAVLSLAVSPDGSTAAVVTAAGARLWDVTTGRPKPLPAGGVPAAPAPFRDTPFGLDPFRRNPFFPPTPAAAPASSINTLPRRTLAVAFSPDGRLIWERERTTLVAWDAKTLAGRAAVPARYDPRAEVAISPDGRYAAVSTINRDVAVWDLNIGKRARTLPTRPPDLTEAERKALNQSAKGPRSLAFGPRGVLAVADPAGVSIWDLTKPDKTPTQTIAVPGGVQTVLMTADGKRVVGSAPDGVVVWDASSGQVVRRFAGVGGAIAASPAGDLVAAAGPSAVRPTGGRQGTKPARPVTVWDVDTGAEIAVLSGHDAAVTSVAFFPDGRRLITGSSGDGGGAVVWDLALAVGRDPDMPDAAHRQLVLDELWRRLDAEDVVVGYQAAAALALRPADAVALLRERLAEVPGERRPGRAATALAWAGSPDAMALLSDLSADKRFNAQARAALRSALRRYAAPPAAPVADPQWAGVAPDNGVGSAPTTRPVTLAVRPPLADADLVKLRAAPSKELAHPFAQRADARVVPLAREWLAAEAAADRLETASPRLLAALEVASAFRLADLVPDLIALHDRETTDVTVRQRLVGTITWIASAFDGQRDGDGGPARPFLKKQLADPTLIPEVRLRVVAALAAGGDAAARDLMLAALADELAARGRRGHPVDERPFTLIRDTSADPAVADRVDALAARQFDPVRRRDLAALADEVRANARPFDALAAQAQSDDVARPRERYAAIGALGRRGGPAELTVLAGLKPWSTPKEFSREEPTANQVSLASAREGAIDEIRRRHWQQALAEPPPMPSPPPTTRPAPATGPATAPAAPPAAGDEGSP